MSSVIINTGPKASQGQGTVITMGGSHHLLPANIYTSHSNGQPKVIQSYSGSTGQSSAENLSNNGNEGSKTTILQNTMAGKFGFSFNYKLQP